MRRHTRLVLIATQRERLRANIQEIRQRFSQFDYSTRLYQREIQNSLDRKLEALARFEQIADAHARRINLKRVLLSAASELEAADSP